MSELAEPAFTIYTKENVEAVSGRNHFLYYNSDAPRVHLESALALLQQGQILHEVTGVPLDTAMLAIQISHGISPDKTWRGGGYGIVDDYQMRRSPTLSDTVTGGVSSNSQFGTELHSPCQ